MFIPQAGQSLTVMLPSETMRAEVTRVVNRDTVIVKIGQPMMRTHAWRKDDLVACRRKTGVLGETWEAVEERPALPDEVVKPKAKGFTKPAKPAPKKKVARK